MQTELWPNVGPPKFYWARITCHTVPGSPYRNTRVLTRHFQTRDEAWEWARKTVDRWHKEFPS